MLFKQQHPMKLCMIKYPPFPDSLECKGNLFLFMEEKTKQNVQQNQLPARKGCLPQLNMSNQLYIVKNCLKLSPLFLYKKFSQPFQIPKPYNRNCYSVLTRKSTSTKAIFKTVHFKSTHMQNYFLTNLRAII